MRNIINLKFLFAITLALGAGFMVWQMTGISKAQLFSNTQNNMKLSSSVFENNGMIPPKYTCNGENISPPLGISGVPSGAKSLALIVHDGDAPVAGGWTHWVVFNINPATTMISENSFPTDSVQGMTSFGKPGYGGPCPPSGTHHYEFRLYALDEKLPLDASATKSDVEISMQNHIIEQYTLVGLYQQNK